MPYELGLDIGALTYGNKKTPILVTDKYHYQKVLSDIAGQDIENHNDDAYLLVIKIRNWFSVNFTEKHIAGQREIWNAFNQFMEDFNSTLKAENYSDKEIDEVPISDFIKFSKDWIKTFQEQHL